MRTSLTLSHLEYRRGSTLAGVLLCTALTFAQSDPSSIQPLRTTPTEKLTVNPGFRDWGPTTIAGTTILGGNPTGRGGLFAIDMATGKVKWTLRPVFNGGTASVATAPAVSGDIAITPFSAANPGAVVAVSLATGKEAWRGPDPAQHAMVAVNSGLAYVLSKDNNFYALDAATGRERWKVGFARDNCDSVPIVRDGTVYVGGNVLVTPADANRAAGYYRFLFALDAATGKERWRYPEAPQAGLGSGVCLSQPIVTADTVFAVGDESLYAVNLATGRERWKPIEIRRPVEGRVRAVAVRGLVDAGPVLIGMTPGFLIAFDKASGATAWEVPGEYNVESPCTTVAGRVLYFQGSPNSAPAAHKRSTLHALDLDTRAILWSFSRPTQEPDWPFGHVTPVNGGLWADSYQALVKLQ